MRALGCKVVAVDSQGLCLRRLRKEFGEDRYDVMEPKAAGAAPETAIMRTSEVHVLSTLSDAFVQKTRASGRFTALTWSGEETVAVTTLDTLITAHGMPRFVKIDVEGFESEALAGLSHTVSVISFEWRPEIQANSLSCLSRLFGLGN